MNKLKLVSAVLISLSIGIIYAKDVKNINDQAEEIIYLYAEIIDSKNSLFFNDCLLFLIILQLL